MRNGQGVTQNTRTDAAEMQTTRASLDGICLLFTCGLLNVPVSSSDK